MKNLGKPLILTVTHDDIIKSVINDRARSTSR